MIEFNSWLSEVVVAYSKLGWYFGLLFAFLENIFPPFPIFVIIGANVAAYGLFIGFLISYIGRVSGAIFTFSFIRAIFYDRFDKRFKETGKFKKFEKWLGKRSFLQLLLVLSFPFTPNAVIHAVAALSTISKRKYIWALVLGNFFMISFVSFVAYNLKLATATNSWIRVIVILVVFAMVAVVGKLVEKKLDL